GGEAEAGAEDAVQRLDVLAGGDAAEQDDLAARETLDGRRQGTCVAQQGSHVASLGDVDRDARVAPERGQRHGRLRGSQAICGGDHEHARYAGGRTGEGARIAELPPEVEPAQKAEPLADLDAATPAEPPGEVEAGFPVPQEARPLAAARGGREQEHAMLVVVGGSCSLGGRVMIGESDGHGGFATVPHYKMAGACKAVVARA